MDKVERFYFYKMYRVIMALLQSDCNKATTKALDDENLAMSKCYEIYLEKPWEPLN